ncbi:MAG: hypothetical protein KBT03_05255 [Bacteroidales bacterium]|nr:hypothetical protein [Candidatus Scybalousia scybalohippi]
MSAPKTVTKVTKNGIEFTSNVDYCSYTIKELCRGALRDVAKFVRAEFKKSYYEHFNKRTGDASKAVSAKIWSSENTQYPRVDLGLKGVKGFYGFFQEVGASNIPKLGLLQHAVEDNISTIIEIEGRYLSAIESDAESLIDESETEIDEE